MENLNAEFEDIQISSDSNAHSLLKQIKKKLGSSFVTESVQQEASESRRCHEEAVLHYFKNRIIMDALVKASYSQSEKEDIPSFYFTGILKYAQQCESSLPFSLEHVSNELKNRKMSKSDIEKYSIQFENKIAEFCIKLSGCTKISGSQDWKKTFTKAFQYISSKADNLNLEASKIRPQKLVIQEMIYLLYTELKEGLTYLHRIRNLFEKKYTFQLDLAQELYLDSQCLLLKMRVFEKRVQNMTYTPESLSALRIISQDLDSRKETAVIDRVRSEDRLEEYEELGSDYISLVEIFRELTEKIEQQKWSISKLLSKNVNE